MIRPDTWSSKDELCYFERKPKKNKNEVELNSSAFHVLTGPLFPQDLWDIA
jgi:hypothetical protein